MKCYHKYLLSRQQLIVNLFDFQQYVCGPKSDKDELSAINMLKL